jgi:hypothetical protein
LKTANVVLGKRPKRKYKKIIRDKIAYLKYLQTKSYVDRTEYKRKCAIEKREVRKLNRESWDNYISNIEYDVHGAQDTAYKVMKHLNSTERDTAFINNITEDQWFNFYKDLWTNETENEIDPELNDLLTVDRIALDGLEGILKSFKNKKSPGNDGMNIELLKYASVEIKVRFIHIINICWNMHKIPDERTRGVICPIFKKLNRWNCNNY